MTNGDGKGPGDGAPSALPRAVDEGAASREQIPVIDMAGLEGGDARRRDRAVAAVARACQEWGFFQVINHGISEELLDRVKKTSREFFDLPVEERLTYAVKPRSRSGYYSKRIDINSGDNSHVLSEKHVDHFYHFFSPPHLKNIESWPRRPAMYREAMDAYGKEVKSLSLKLLGLCARGLGLRETYFEDVFGDAATHSVRVNFYPPMPSLASRTVGLSEHSDPGGITLLLQGDVVGLQVRAKDGQWVDVHPVKNALVINVGDQLEILTNGRYKSVEHRGMLSGTEERLSLAAFYSPSLQAHVAPAAGLLDDAHPPLYASSTYADYLTSFFERGLEGKDHVNRKFVQS